MPPAARLGDPTSHGIPLAGNGSPTVLIRGRPAWRIIDFHSCPMFDGKSPHVGGLVSGGCPKVLINGAPATMMGDMIVEAAGPPNAIIAGEPTVLICEPPSGAGLKSPEAAKTFSPSSELGSQKGSEGTPEGKAETIPQKDELPYIKGQVVDDATGNPVRDVPVVITADDGTQLRTKTDDRGFYEILNVRKGNYKIAIDLEGQEDIKTEVNV